MDWTSVSELLGARSCQALAMGAGVALACDVEPVPETERFQLAITTAGASISGHRG